MTHYFDQDPESEHRYRLIEAEFEGQSFSFRTDSGVFSGTEVDYGTALLLDSVLQQGTPHNGVCSSDRFDCPGHRSGRGIRYRELYPGEGGT